jgi:hypothetical protein
MSNAGPISSDLAGKNVEFDKPGRAIRRLVGGGAFVCRVVWRLAHGAEPRPGFSGGAVGHDGAVLDGCAANVSITVLDAVVARADRTAGSVVLRLGGPAQRLPPQPFGEYGSKALRSPSGESGGYSKRSCNVGTRASDRLSTPVGVRRGVRCGCTLERCLGRIDRCKAAPLGHTPGSLDLVGHAMALRVGYRVAQRRFGRDKVPGGEEDFSHGDLLDDPPLWGYRAGDQWLRSEQHDGLLNASGGDEPA